MWGPGGQWRGWSHEDPGQGDGLLLSDLQFLLLISLCCLGPTKLSLILNGFILEGFVILISGHKPRLPLSFYPWCHLFLSMVSFLCCSLVAKSCPTLCDLMHWSTSGSSVCGNSQARMLESAAISFSRGSSPLRDRTHISCTGKQILYHAATWKYPIKHFTLLFPSLV